MPREFYFEIHYFFTVTETLNRDKSDSNQCYSEVFTEFYWI